MDIQKNEATKLKYRFKELYPNPPNGFWADIADKTGISRQTIYKYINQDSESKGQIRYSTLVKIAAYLNVPVNELINQ
jgi:transcriptional regulator with XRE-family HTH domain